MSGERGRTGLPNRPRKRPSISEEAAISNKPSPTLPCGSFESETGFVSGKSPPHPGWRIIGGYSRVKQPVLIPIGSRGHVSLIRLAASLNIDTQDRQDKQDEKLVHKKLIGSIIECAFVENLSVLRGPSRIPFESFPTPWNPFADSSFALLTDPLSPLVEIFSPFPTFGGSLLSFLREPLRGPSGSLSSLFVGIPSRIHLLPS